VETQVSDTEEPVVINDEMLIRIGRLTRDLHDNLRLLGYDTMLEKVASEIPDVKDRLGYVIQMTEQAAQRVLNATDLCSPLQDKIINGSSGLVDEWNTLLSTRNQYTAHKELAERTIAFLGATQEDARITRQQLIDIMLAQDFQDLTGQVVKRITQLAHDMETQLVKLLVDFAPEIAKADAGNGLLNGPQVNTAGKTDIVTNQEQVDDLLDSLGF
jgi:chemotaxis protein CheZ